MKINNIKNMLLGVLFCLFFFQCEDKQVKLKQVKLSSVVLNPTIKLILKEYIKENNSFNCQNQLYIDVQSPIFTVFTLSRRCYHKENLRIKNPLNITYIDGVPFFIFSGIELYASDLDSNIMRVAASDLQNKPCNDTKECYCIFWNIVDSAGHTRVIKEGAGFPFIPLGRR